MSSINNTVARILGGAGYHSEEQPLWRGRGRGWGVLEDSDVARAVVNTVQ